MQEVIDNEIEDMLAMGIIERSEAPYASPLVLVKKPDGSCRVCVNFKDLNKITVFDPDSVKFHQTRLQIHPFGLIISIKVR